MTRKRIEAEKVPSYDKLMVPILKALIALGGLGTIEGTAEFIGQSMEKIPQ